MEEQNSNKAPIDLIKIYKKLVQYKKLYYRVLPATMIISYLIICCIPRYYICSVSLAPEPTGGGGFSGSLTSLASSFGFGSSAKTGGDALNVDIYPDIIASNDFIANLMTVEVTTKKGDVKTNYYTYLRDHQRLPWWSRLEGSFIEWISPSPKDIYEGKEKISVFNLTKLQSDIFGSVKGRVSCSIDKKTDVISISVKDQDPQVSAIMADATCKLLQQFIVDYRTNKARIDYEYYKKLEEDSKTKYEKAVELYSTFSDSNYDLQMEKYKSKLTDLENDMQLKYDRYKAMNNERHTYAAKLQEATPAFTVFRSASIPIKPAGPKRVFISLFMTILSFMALSVWLLVKK